LNQTDKYEFSFTGANLRLQDMLTIGKSEEGGTDLNTTIDLGRGKSSTGKSIYSKLLKRIKALTSLQLYLLLNSDLISQKHIAFLSVCKCHGFIREFVIEVIREKYLVFDYEVNEADYISFYRRKNELHFEMDTLKIYTQKKIRQVTFRILEQGGLIDNTKNKIIQTQIIDQKVLSAIIADNPEWLKLFLMSDIDINNATESYHAHKTKI
jgi:hypothetical protein